MIDTHAHVFHRGLALSPGRRYTPDYDALPQTYIGLLDQHHVSHGVLVPVSILGTSNGYLVDAVRASNGRLKGLVTLDPERDLQEIAAWNSHGICGFRLNLMGAPLIDLRSGPWKRALAQCQAHGWLVELNDSAARLSETLTPLLDAGVPVVVDHFGQPDQKLGTSDPGFQYLCALGRTNRVWVKMSAPYRIGYPNAMQAAGLLRRSYPPDRLLWASDWPFTGFESTTGLNYARACNYMREWIDDEQERHQIMHVSAARLFGFSRDIAEP